MNNNPSYNDSTASCLGAQMSPQNPAAMSKPDLQQFDRLYDALTEATETAKREFLPPALLHSLDVSTILLGEWLDRHNQIPDR